MAHFDERSGVVECPTDFGSWHQTMEEVVVSITTLPEGAGGEAPLPCALRCMACFKFRCFPFLHCIVGPWWTVAEMHHSSYLRPLPTQRINPQQTNKQTNRYSGKRTQSLNHGNILGRCLEYRNTTPSCRESARGQWWAAPKRKRRNPSATARCGSVLLSAPC